MKISFNKIHIHHFLSIDDATIDLKDKGYCLVIGINKNPKDAAKSNGSGKSSIWNAISYALVGETLNGLKTNLANLYFDDGCYVELEFEVDGNKYKVIRSKEDATLGTNLKIYINDEDRGGKGIRESQALLDQYLPDLTKELLGSVVILGQGLPQKFTSNSPSGRKEVLEHLSKSDFMIQDLKQRIDDRLTILNEELRKEEDDSLTLSTELQIYKQQLEANKEKLEKLTQQVGFDAIINSLNAELKENTPKLDEANKRHEELDAKIQELRNKIITEGEIKQERLEKVHGQYVKYSQDISNRKAVATSDRFKVEQELKTLQAITDVCPTCGQKIPNVIKPDTTQKETELVKYDKLCLELGKEFEDNEQDYRNTKSQINEMYFNAVKDIQANLDLLVEEDKIVKADAFTYSELIKSLESKLIVVQKDKENHDKDIANVENEIKTLDANITTSSTKLDEVIKSKTLTSNHISAVNKMNTLIKRDFRGVLLKNVIDYINTKAKEYCTKIFNSDSLEFLLSGNDLDIIFEGKDYENLSGGEKQRIDIIVQFAIRDMMSRYLGFSSNILVLDEITDALDSISCDKVINFITTELKDVESVFIVSHHATELQLPNDSTIIVEKNELGISEVK